MISIGVLFSDGKEYREGGNCDSVSYDIDFAYVKKDDRCKVIPMARVAYILTNLQENKQ